MTVNEPDPNAASQACATAARRTGSPGSARVFAGIGCLAVSAEHTSWVAPKTVRYSRMIGAIFAEAEISLPAVRSPLSSMIAVWMLVPRKAADEPATD
jgi:hypothetical protein